MNLIPSFPAYPAQAPVPARITPAPSKLIIRQITKPARSRKVLENEERMKKGMVRPKKATHMGGGVVGVRAKKSAGVEYL